MNKVEFTKLIADKAECTQKEAVAFLNAFDEVMLEEVFAKEDSIRLGIGTFSGYTRETKDRKARNPRTGEELFIKGVVTKGYPKFKPSKAAKE